MFHKFQQLLSTILLILCAAGFTSVAAADEAPTAPWVGFHCMAPNRADLPKMKRLVDELARLGVNVLVLQVDYRFQFASYPQVGGPEWFNKEDARDLVAHCRSRGIRLIPQLSCVGHQSPGGSQPAYGLLREFPQFDEAPHLSETAEGFYCREWCPSHPDVYPVVYALIDEIIDAFDADAFHVGMDEVMCIASPACPRCAHHDPGELFAGVVKQLHAHITEEKGLPMLMWGDRLVQQSTIPGANRNEASDNGTHTAIDLIPKDIVICDWRYRSFDEYQRAYPSVGYFLSHGFKIWPSGGWNCKNVKSFHEHALALRKETTDVVGFLCTTWDKIAIADAASSPSIRDVLPAWKNA